LSHTPRFVPVDRQTETFTRASLYRRVKSNLDKTLARDGCVCVTAGCLQLILFTEQFNEILDYFKKIDEVDTEGVEPTYHVLDLKNVSRTDETTPSLPIEEALRNAPKKEKKFIKAPRII